MRIAIVLAIVGIAISGFASRLGPDWLVLAGFEITAFALLSLLSLQIWINVIHGHSQPDPGGRKAIAAKNGLAWLAGFAIYELIRHMMS